jgi:hypothetical protein
VSNALVPDPAVQPTMRVDEVKDVFQISRGAAYEAVKTGDIPSIRIGGRIVIPTSWVRRALQLDDQGSR